MPAASIEKSLEEFHWWKSHDFVCRRYSRGLLLPYISLYIVNFPATHVRIFDQTYQNSPVMSIMPAYRFAPLFCRENILLMNKAKFIFKPTHASDRAETQNSAKSFSLESCSKISPAKKPVTADDRMTKRELLGKSIRDLFDKGSHTSEASRLPRVEVPTQSSHLWPYTGIQRKLQTKIYSDWWKVFVRPGEIYRLKLKFMLRLPTIWSRDVTLKDLQLFMSNRLYYRSQHFRITFYN